MSETGKVALYGAIAAIRDENGNVAPHNAYGMEQLVQYTQVLSVSTDPNPAVAGRLYRITGDLATFTLPAADTVPKNSIIIMDLTDNGDGITVAKDAGDTINGGAIIFYEDGEKWSFVSDGVSAWQATRLIHAGYKSITAASGPDSLGFSRQVQNSNRRSSERQNLGSYVTGESAGGDIQFELLWGELDEYIAAALQGFWTRLTPVSHNNATALGASDWTARGWVKFSGVTATGTTFTGADFSGQSARIGKFVDVTVLTEGGTTAAAIREQRIARVSAVSGTTITFDLATFDITSGDWDIIIQNCDEVSNGSALYDFSLLRHYSDIGADRAYFRGMNVNNFTINLQAPQGITGTINFVGQDEQDATATLGSEDIHPWSSNNTMVANEESLEGILEGPDGSLARFCATSISITFGNNITSTDTTCGPVAASGTFTANGTLNGLYGAKGKAMYQRYLAFADTGIFVPMRDDDGRALAFYLPRGKLSDANRAGDNNNQVSTSFSFTGQKQEGANGKTAYVYSAPQMTKFS